MNEKNIARFESLLRSTEREGIEDLISYLRKSDFYTAPASAKYHSCHEGGLIEHSLNVYDCLKNKVLNPTWHEILLDVPGESLIISALLHDFCKHDFYAVDYKNQKVYSDHGKKSDAGGRFDWESVPYYKYENNHPLGHGEGSVIMLQQFIKLKPIELYAIRWHMGFSVPKDEYGDLGEAIKKYPFIVALNSADLEATYLLEKEE